MKRWVPEVRALYERVRRPTIMIVTGLVLTAPAAGMLFVEEEESASTMDLASVGPVVRPAKASTAPNVAASAVGTAWKDKAVDRERRKAAEEFARRYRISTKLADQIYSAAKAEGIDPRVAFGLVQTESSFRRTVVSSAGAIGYTQVLPSTARWMEPGTKRSDLFDTETNLRLGFKYLDYLLDKYNGNMRLALTAYNRGPGTVDRLLKQGRNPENGYATKVLRHLS